MRLTLRHRGVLEAMADDNLTWDAAHAVYRYGTNVKTAYEPQLLEDLYAAGFASPESAFLPTEAGYAALESPTWPPRPR